jgi:hypothetical protein
MAKKNEEKAMEPATPQAMTPFEPSPIDNLPTYLKGLEVTNPIVLEDGMGFRAKLLGPGGEVEFERADRDGQVDILQTWRFQNGENIFRVLGATILDRELGNICRNYELPVEVGVVRSGQKEIAGGKRLSLYTVAVDLKGKQKVVVPTAGGPDF